MKPLIHAQSSACKWGGLPTDYLEIHDFFDHTKSHFGDNRHRVLLHSSWGIFIVERIFGHTIINSDDKEVSVRDIGEQHILEDMKFIPTVADYLNEMEYADWMHGKGVPASFKKIDEKIKSKSKEREFIPFNRIDAVYDGSRNKFPNDPNTLVFDDSKYDPQMLID